ncbi:HpcH/HpaI aldolase/citrate lyase family protein [Nocardioides pinisoli]|uniref:HpcH/HpaI aldolase/citrate lyase family protein n=1 Tax=Nocardioides pinisoli TaxID=2950279 RepID=A0ABT1L0B3_9ACTN|nr:HpcH/HpaI aldolase/citrate lyase family protein [Nocardioides pinisoli]MCP3423463.1 HpcH/HpaI aldolase/citrate lyase family protein [Nocardioides pinisoli]
MERLDHLVGGLTDDLDARLADVDAALASHYPGERAGRQPVHTVYVPADRFHPGLVADHGAAALAAVEEHQDRLLALLDGDRDLLSRVRAKLGREPVEDLRIDFEDGYGTRPDDEEDGDVRRAAGDLRAALDAGTSAPFTGIRFKGFEGPTRARGVRTLTLFLARLLEDGPLPDTFVVTLPKVTAVEQVEALVHVAGRLEPELGLADGALRFEIQVETPQSILGPDGSALVARMVHASGGRCTGLHYGTYDYSASCGIAAAHQSLEHPVADHAKAVMQAAAAGTGVRLSDGSTNVLPVGSPDEVAAAWDTHLRLVRRSLERGYYQGWDLHPAQLPTRFAATFGFYRDGLASAATRLRTYVERRESGVLDEPATARALADYLLRGTDCGALSQDEVTEGTGLDAHRLARLAHRTHDGGG